MRLGVLEEVQYSVYTTARCSKAGDDHCHLFPAHDHAAIIALSLPVQCIECAYCNCLVYMLLNAVGMCADIHEWLHHVCIINAPRCFAYCGTMFRLFVAPKTPLCMMKTC